MVVAAEKTEKFVRDLAKFGRVQLDYSNSRVVKQSSSGVVIAGAFFLGAAEVLAKKLKIKSQAKEELLVQFFMEFFEEAERSARHLVSTAKRLAKKYQLLEEAHSQGAKAMALWLKGDESLGSVLPELLQKHEQVSLMELDAEGFVSPPEELKARAKAKTVAGARKRRVAVFAFILFLIAVAAANYFLLAR